MIQVRSILPILLSFVIGYFLGEHRENLYLSVILRNVSIREKEAQVPTIPIEVEPETIEQEIITCPICPTCAPIPEKEETIDKPLYGQRCGNKAQLTGWDAFNSLMLKNNTIYNVIKDHKLALDLWSWDSFEKFINVLLPEVAKNSKSDIIKVIEVGSWKGQSTVDHANKCREITKKFNKRCIVIAVDTWLGSMEHYEQPRHAPKVAEDYATNLFWSFLNNMVLKNVSDIVYPLRLPSAIAAHVLHCFKIEADMILIDADHDYAPVLRDFELYYPLVRKGGIFYGHDYAWFAAADDFLAPRKDKVDFWLGGACFFMRKKEDAVFFNQYN